MRVNMDSQCVESDATLKNSTRPISEDMLTPAVHDEINELLKSFGLVEQENAIVGGCLRLSSQCSLSWRTQQTGSKTPFLDEPTSGLDTESAYQVMEF